MIVNIEKAVLLVLIANYDEGQSRTEVIQRCPFSILSGIAVETMQGKIDQLVQQGLVERRNKLLYATEDGHREAIRLAKVAEFLQ